MSSSSARAAAAGSGLGTALARPRSSRLHASSPLAARRRGSGHRLVAPLALMPGVTRVKSGATWATSPSSLTEHTTPSAPDEAASLATLATCRPGLPAKPAAARSAAERLVRTVTTRVPASWPAAPSRRPEAAASSMACPPVPCTVTHRAPTAPRARAARLTVFGMSCSLASAKTGFPSPASAAMTAGPGPDQELQADLEGAHVRKQLPSQLQGRARFGHVESGDDGVLGRLHHHSTVLVRSARRSTPCPSHHAFSSPRMRPAAFGSAKWMVPSARRPKLRP